MINKSSSGDSQVNPVKYYNFSVIIISHRKGQHHTIKNHDVEIWSNYLTDVLFL